MNDKTLLEAMYEFEDHLEERQFVFQEQLGGGGGGSAMTQEPGRFEFTLNPYVDRPTEILGGGGARTYLHPTAASTWADGSPLPYVATSNS